MARIESTAIAGAYFTPLKQVPRIAQLLQLEEYEDEALKGMTVSVLDPCAGEGEAIEQLTRLLLRGREAADARNAERDRERNAEYVKAQRLRDVDRCRKCVDEATSDLARKKHDPYLSEKKRAKVVERAEMRLRTAERALQHALVAAGLAEAAPAVAPVPVVEPDDDGEEDDEEGEPDENDNDAGEGDDDAAEVQTGFAAAMVAVMRTREIEHADVYAVELERGRHKVLHERPGFGYHNRNRALHGDAFCATFTVAEDGGVGLLYLNPPYDIDKVCGRTEERFLRRFTAALAPGGVLAFVVPHYALDASASTLATHFEDVSCYRFAGDDFATYKQVVLFAKKLRVARLEPDPKVLAEVTAWAKSADGCAELPEDAAAYARSVGLKLADVRYVVPMHDQHDKAIDDWKVKVVDVAAVLGEFEPWHETTRKSVVPLRRVVPDFALVDVMHRTYEVATPPRPAHIAAGLAAGLFNGQRIEPDDPASKLPALLVKGVFDREWRTVEEKHNKDGEKTGEVQVQTPKLVVTALDLERHTYHTLKQSAETSTGGRTLSKEECQEKIKEYVKRRDEYAQQMELSESEYLLSGHREDYASWIRSRRVGFDHASQRITELMTYGEREIVAPKSAADMSVGDLLAHYGKALMGVMDRQCVVLYDPRRDAGKYALCETPRKLFVAQAHAARGILTVLDERGGTRQPILIGEIGCLRGDTMIHDPVAGDTVAVAERYRRAEPFHVWALSPQGDPVVAAAMPPAKYPVAQMVKVTMDGGSSVVVTPAHRFWDGESWVRASDLAFEIRQRGSVPVLLPTISDSDLQVRARDASRWTRKAPGSPDGCLPYHCSGDGQPLLGEGNDQGSVPSRDGVRERSLDCLHEGETGHERARNHSCRSVDHRSMKDFVPHEGDQHLELFLPPLESHSSNELGSTLEHQRSLAGSFLARTSGEQGVDGPASTFSSSSCRGESQSSHPLRESVSRTSRGLSSTLELSPESSSPTRTEGVREVVVPDPISSWLEYNLSEKKCKRVVAVEPVDAEHYYDFHVPVFNNYWAAGIWHHNSGKSTVSIVAARSHGAKRVLVFCPPHLLDSWRNEVAAVFPDADYRVLASVSDVDGVASADPARFLVAVVSREAAKLGHRLEGVADRCPACGADVEESAEDVAKKRGRCEVQDILPANDCAHLARRMALRLRAHWQALDGIGKFLPKRLRPGVVSLRRAAFKMATAEKPAYEGLPADLLREVREVLVKACDGNTSYNSPARPALAWALVAGGAEPAVVLAAARRLKPSYFDSQHFAESLLLFLPPGGVLAAAFEILESFPAPSYHSASSVEWFKQQYAKLSAATDTVATDDADADAPPPFSVREEVTVGSLRLTRVEGGIAVDGLLPGSVKAAGKLLHALGEMSVWKHGPVCGEPLYQSVPEPRRYPLAKYIVKRHRKTFDFVIIDECHEVGNNADSAQSVAGHRLTSLRLPSILMTGTIMNGYAESLFANFWATDMEFRDEFSRRDQGAFVDRYGYRKRLVSDKADGKVVAFGAQTDRVERSEKDVGSAPGVLPLFLFKHLLRGAVTLHKADLRIDLPPLSQERAVATAEGDLLAEFQRLQKKLVEQIKADRYDEERSGKLFGQLSELPSYLDRATTDVGNGYREFEIRYPESVGGGLVAAGKLFPKDTILPKEEIMLDFVERELKEGRRVMVHGWHLALLPRLARLIEECIGEAAPILYADKVPTAKRQAWIDKYIVGKKIRVMVTNPVCIQTGLNCLTHFASIWQHQNPCCNPIIDRQSIGRIDRIGQKLDTRVRRAYYGETLQEKMYDLLMQKVAISTATDGLSPESALMAAGVDPGSFLTGLSLGRELWKLMEESSLDERPMLRVVNGGRRR